MSACDRAVFLRGLLAAAASPGPLLPAHAFGDSLGAALVREYVNAINTRNFQWFTNCISQNYYEHDPHRGQGRDGLVDYFKNLTDHVPDFRAGIVDLITSSDRVAARMSYVGTTDGNRRLETRPIEFWRIGGGLLTEHWDGSEYS